MGRVMTASFLRPERSHVDFDGGARLLYPLATEATVNSHRYVEAIELEGVITDVLPSTTFRVSLENGHSVMATLCGKMRRFRIRVLAGDRVKVDVSPYDLTRGRITFRHR